MSRLGEYGRGHRLSITIYIPSFVPFKFVPEHTKFPKNLVLGCIYGNVALNALDLRSSAGVLMVLVVQDLALNFGL